MAGLTASAAKNLSIAAGGLVTNGPYRFIRHPIYTAVCLFVWTGVLSSTKRMVPRGLLSGVVRLVSLPFSEHEEHR